MALKFPISFPIFVPLPPPKTCPHPCLNPSPNAPNQGRPMELRFSRWNSANAEKFNERRRTQQEIEDDIRRYRRFDSANNIATADDSATTSATAKAETFKSHGTPSSPSAPSIPGKKSKYSKPQNSHPAFRKISKTAVPPREAPICKRVAKVTIGEDGVSYVIDGAPFEFKYSYTETPKVKPLKLREPYAPFGPTTMPRPWTGRAPLPPSKKKMKEFDSFVLPPPNKKGVKPVQKPGPFLPGTGPRYVQSREEILGEPLTEQEVKDLVSGCIKSKRQLNIGRDGLTHNMLDNIHAHWKRRRVCKIKCKGVCTVDMDNVCQQLEDKTGGKVIYRRGGVLFLFRGRNYNYKYRLRFPLMLWKPVTPVYPRLIQHVPEDLTLEEATEMRNSGRKLMPICKLAKNGVYNDLVKNVREAFEECELVRINCQGIKGSDYRKIGAKLKDLVPCVLLSFENEHILIWRGRKWKSSLPEPVVNSANTKESNANIQTAFTRELEDQENSAALIQTSSIKNENLNKIVTGGTSASSQEMHVELMEDLSSVENDRPYATINVNSTARETTETTTDGVESEIMENSCEDVIMFDAKIDGESEVLSKTYKYETMLDETGSEKENQATISMGNDVRSRSQLGSSAVGSLDNEEQQDVPDASQDISELPKEGSPCTERVLLLLNQAVESGIAVVLDEETLDADRVYERSVAFAQSAPPGPVFRHRPRKAAARKNEKLETEVSQTEVLQVKEVAMITKEGEDKRLTSKNRNTSKSKIMNGIDENYSIVAPQGSLKVDELAKLLS